MPTRRPRVVHADRITVVHPEPGGHQAAASEGKISSAGVVEEGAAHERPERPGRPPAAPVGITKHLASLPPQPEALSLDAEMQARVELDSARIMAAIDAPTTVFEVLTTAHGIPVVELDGPFDGLHGHYLQHKDGTRLLVVPAGQDPSTRLWAARALLTHQGVMPA